MTANGSVAAQGIRVFLVDDHAVVRRGMHAFFDMLDDIEVIGEAVDGRAALDQLAVLAAPHGLPRGILMGLTPREREILVLVAQGKSNHDIADTLVISERTARTHVSNVLSKLGLASRTQAALWAIREGLVSSP